MKKLLTICAVVLMVFTVQANAVLITHPHSQGIGNYNVSFNSDTSYQSTYLGRFVMSVASSSTLPPEYPVYPYVSSDDTHPYSFYSYCIDPFSSIGYGHTATYDFTIGSLAGSDGISASEAVLIEELFGRYSPLLQNDPTGPYAGGTFRTASAAIQLSIWKIILDTQTETLGDWDFASGLMRVGTITAESGASKTANVVALEMLNSLTGTGPMASGLQGLRRDGTQDVLIQVVPEPSSIIALVGGLGSLLALRRRRA